MTDLCAIQGQLVDVRNVFTDKCVKLTIHVSAERAMEVMNAFGWPTNVSPVPVAIARLNSDQKGGEANLPASGPNKTQPAPEPDPPVRAPRSWNEITPAQQAGIRCNEPAFVKFLNSYFGLHVGTTDEAAKFIQSYCGVESRRDIRDGGPLVLWQMLEGKYKAWQLAPKAGVV